jgi:geranylgeranyl pyrophosphate synthase
MVPMAARAAYDGAIEIGLSPDQAGALVAELMRASGAAGMIGGQLLDLEGEGESLSVDQLERIHSLKTGALIAASVRLGGMAAGADESRIAALDEYGRAVGLAFQIADDVLDVTATTDQLGKTAGKDLAFHKSTYPALLGVEGAVARAGELADSACRVLRSAGLLTAELEGLARLSVDRKS